MSLFIGSCRKTGKRQVLRQVSARALEGRSRDARASDARHSPEVLLTDEDGARRYSDEVRACQMSHLSRS